MDPIGPVESGAKLNCPPVTPKKKSTKKVTIEEKSRVGDHLYLKLIQKRSSDWGH